MSFSADNARFMARALELAQQGLFTTDPNPRVGCVLVKDGEVIGEGFHKRAGEGHAEVEAIRASGKQHLFGATAYVTLEPCCHQGRTGPCSTALIEAGVARVVVAMRDPNPSVDGGGLKQLADAVFCTVKKARQHREAARGSPQRRFNRASLLGNSGSLFAR